MTALSIDTLLTLRQRRQAGERVSILAREVGLPWQKLEKALRHGIAADPPASPYDPPTLPCLPCVGPLTERYRPRSLQAILGQPSAVKMLQRFAASPRPMAFLFEGDTGTGKTSAALALAGALGCNVEQAEFGGVWTIASGEQSADAVREICRRLHLTPMYGSGWKVAIVNEADRMAKPAETVWLDALEALPPRSVVIFTTNFAGNLAPRFRDRCVRLTFMSDAKRLDADARRLVTGIFRQETGKLPTPTQLEQIVAAGIEDGQFSFRRLVQALQVQLMEGSVL